LIIIEQGNEQRLGRFLDSRGYVWDEWQAHIECYIVCENTTFRPEEL
jgi:hypothetical protein